MNQLETNIRRLTYHVVHNYLTMNNLVVVVALLIAASWAWGSIGVVQKNYALQRVVDDKRRQSQLVQLQTDNLAYEQKYYHSAEYQELQARERLGLVQPGEKVLILPPNSASAKAVDQATSPLNTVTNLPQPSNFQQWVNFLFGGNHEVNS